MYLKNFIQTDFFLSFCCSLTSRPLFEKKVKYYFCLLYRRMLLGRCGEMCYLNKLLMVSVLGWLFQVRHDLRILFIIVYSE